MWSGCGSRCFKARDVNETIRDLLIAVDTTGEPPSYGWTAEFDRVRAVQSALERIAGRRFDLDENVQDATFFTELAIHVPGREAGWIDTVFAIRFSAFGRLFTNWSHGPERLPEAVEAELIRTVEAAGFRFVPPAAANELYTGRYPGWHGMTWWSRFFDYL